MDLADERVASQKGLAPSEGNPQFHQQFVYAVAMKTIRHFERALGRKIVWYPRLTEAEGQAARSGSVAGRGITSSGYGSTRTRIRDANAYYDPDKTALLFGYFTAADRAQAPTIPEGWSSRA